MQLFLGIISFLIMAYKQSVLVGLLILIVSTITVLIKYKITKDRQEYEKESREKYSKFTATLIDFVSNLTTVKN